MIHNEHLLIHLFILYGGKFQYHAVTLIHKDEVKQCIDNKDVKSKTFTIQI